MMEVLEDHFKDNPDVIIWISSFIEESTKSEYNVKPVVELRKKDNGEND